MIRRPKKLFLMLALLLTASALWFAWPRPDIVYQGKPMSQWLRELETDSSRAKSEAADTLWHANPVAVPALLDGLGKRGSLAYRAAWPHLPTLIQSRLTPPANYELLHHRCALILGEIAPPSPQVVRELRRALVTDDDTLTTFAAQALRMIAERETGAAPELQSALPDLRRLLTTRKDENKQVARAVASIERRGL